MKLILDIKENNRIPFFMELIKSLDYISIIKEVKEERKSQFITDLAEAFNDVKLHEQGKKKLKTAKDLLNEL
ncbi:MAG: hypothetical protein COW67_01210 [Flavobacteriales bacterium CG18_big_fil_WC_8_21_14_2_50_32_9]|jgi:hypothetical protein|nr:MAG: hypothetical protein COW67_01210 [Flavobacteriales bacterium CG18_big_fil_WC_8_21_14_2_50_32_9]